MVPGNVVMACDLVMPDPVVMPDRVVMPGRVVMPDRVVMPGPVVLTGVVVPGTWMTRSMPVRGMTGSVDALGPMTSYDAPAMLGRPVPMGASGRLAGGGSAYLCRRARLGVAGVGGVGTRRRRVHDRGLGHVMR
jgi:hypothetical protein